MSVKKLYTLHRPDSQTKAMDGLFKYIGNRAWFARALSYWVISKHPVLEHVHKRKIARRALSQRLLDSVLYGFASSRITLCTAAE